MTKKNRTTQINVTLPVEHEHILPLFDKLCKDANVSRSELIVTLMSNEVGDYAAKMQKQTKDLLADLNGTEADNSHIPEFLL